MADTPIPLGQSIEQISDLVRTMARALVDQPESVQVEHEHREAEIVLRLVVPEHEVGKLIGKQGRTARSLRSIMGAAANKLHLRCALDIRAAE